MDIASIPGTMRLTFVRKYLRVSSRFVFEGPPSFWFPAESPLPSPGIPRAGAIVPTKRKKMKSKNEIMIRRDVESIKKCQPTFLAGVGATRVTQEGNKFPLKKGQLPSSIKK